MALEGDMRFLAEDDEGGVQIFEADTWDEAEDHCYGEVWDLKGEIVAVIEGEDVDASLERIDLADIVVTTVNTLQ
jgi:hypothetical protein